MCQCIKMDYEFNILSIKGRVYIVFKKKENCENLRQVKF